MADIKEQRDALSDFTARPVSLLGKTRTVFVSGSGPAVIVMAEMPGISPAVAQFARRVRDQGLTVYMPNLFGDPGRPIDSRLYVFGTLAKVCIAGQFHALKANSSGPITQWLMALARLAHEESGGPGVGAIGMCFTGNFALSMMLEPAVIAPVLAQPSLPLGKEAGLHIAPDELAAVKARMEKEDLTVLAYRFEGDAFCKAARFEAYQAALGDRFRPTVLPDSSANPNAVMKNPHSVVTHHLIDEEGQPTRRALDEILGFFKAKLAFDHAMGAAGGQP